MGRFLVLVLTFLCAGVTLGWAQSPVQVGLVYDAQSLAKTPYARETYTSVLEEEGVPHVWLTMAEVLQHPPRELLTRFPSLIVPDALNVHMEPPMAERLRQYVHEGGNLAVIHDAGTRNQDGTFRIGGALLADVLGVAYLRYDTLRAAAYRLGRFRFKSPADARKFQVPPGKLVGLDLSGYLYGALEYPQAAAAVTQPDVQVFAAAPDGVPLLTLRRVGSGQALWVNCPLSYLKANSDDTPMRIVLRTFLFDLAPVPHLVNSPGGVGGMVVNWHVDSSLEHDYLAWFLHLGFARPTLRYEFDVTAGPDREKQGDRQGFDAAGRGRKLLLRLPPYGDIGAHGGWAHDWFAAGVTNGTLTDEQMAEAIRRNQVCLEQVIGKPVVTYAAPGEAHRPPFGTRTLERLGFCAYYTTADTGSPPNRTFFGKARLSAQVWAFPVTPMGRVASLEEMWNTHVRFSDIEKWHRELTDYLVEQRTIRLIYSHPYDLAPGSVRRVVTRLLDRLVSLEAQKKLTVQPMAFYARFMDRLVKTRMSLGRGADTCTVTLQNEEGLEGMCVAIPTSWVSSPVHVPADTSYELSGAYHYFTVRTHLTHVEWSFASPHSAGADRPSTANAARSR